MYKGVIMTKQLIAAVAITALCFLLMAIGWYVGGIVGGLIWCAALTGGMVGIGWIVSLVINTDGWF